MQHFFNRNAAGSWKSSVPVLGSSRNRNSVPEPKEPFMSILYCMILIVLLLTRTRGVPIEMRAVA